MHKESFARQGSELEWKWGNTSLWTLIIYSIQPDHIHFIHCTDYDYALYCIWSQVTWEPYKSSTRNLELPHEYKDHISMIYSCSPCICFNVIAYNRPHQFFKQLGLEEVSIPDDIPDMNIHPEKKLSKYKGKNWKEKGDYGKVNNYWDKTTWLCPPECETTWPWWKWWYA